MLENYQNIKSFLIEKEESIFISLTFNAVNIQTKLDEELDKFVVLV